MALPNASEVKKRHEETLLKQGGVVGVALGNDQNGSEAVVIYVATDDSTIIPSLPHELDGIPVIVELVGGFRAA